MAKSDDTKMVLAGLVTLTSAGRSLASANHLPDAYSGFCQGILRHAKELYPQTAQSCDTTEVAQDNDRIAAAAYGKTLTEAKLLKRVRPIYPYEAKSRGVQGTIILSALISNSGVIEELGLKSGPFLLYAAAFDAVKEWRYSPARIDNKPVDVLTAITINFNLGR
jgi:TonB family protein